MHIFPISIFYFFLQTHALADVFVFFTSMSSRLSGLCQQRVRLHRLEVHGRSTKSYGMSLYIRLHFQQFLHGVGALCFYDWWLICLAAISIVSESDAIFTVRLSPFVNLVVCLIDTVIWIPICSITVNSGPILTALFGPKRRSRSFKYPWYTALPGA